MTMITVKTSKFDINHYENRSCIVNHEQLEMELVLRIRK